MDLFLEQITDLSSVYRKRYVFELVVFGLVLVFLFRLYIPSESIVYVSMTIGLVGLILWFRMKNYNNSTVDLNETIHFRLNLIQSQMYEYVDEQMRKIRFSDTRKFLTKEVYTANLSRVRLSHLYTDIHLINYIYDLLFLYEYNEDSFASMVMAVNGILRIRSELEMYYSANGYLPENTAYQVESAQELMKKALNFAHTFVYKLPKSNDISSITAKIIKKMHILTKKHVTEIKRIAVKRNIQEGINRNTKFTELRDSLPEAREQRFEDTNRFELYI
jgi:hypothetical protein